MFKLVLIFLIYVLNFPMEIQGHGMMLEPPNRSSLWRYYGIDNEIVIPNYEDNQNFCGGFNDQWNEFGGKCGVCGDAYNATHPQDNENTGKFGKFGPVRQYSKGESINVTILLTANHKGFFKYSVCMLEDPTKPEPGEDCFEDLKLADGNTIYRVSSDEHYIYNEVKLPETLICEKCVFRWHYTAGNNWGWCNETYGMVGCGPQETFRSCSDITIS